MLGKKQNVKKVQAGRKVTFRQTYQYHLLMLPGFLVLFIYTIIPFFGNIMAFQNFQQKDRNQDRRKENHREKDRKKGGGRRRGKETRR